MPVNLRPLSKAAPLWVEDDAYDALVQRTDAGWSRCADATEWLAKLHYLREGLRAGKLEQGQFDERESRLVMEWVRRSL